MDKEYSFSVELAKKYGVPEAVILKNLLFWIEKNKANERHFHDGYYWTYNSIKAFTELFPFWTEKQIRGILDRLIKKEVIKTGNYNEKAYDRTLWYTITDESIMGKCICPEGQMEFTNKANEFALEGEPIPYINTDKKPDDKLKETASRILLYLNSKTKKHYKPVNGSLKNITARLKEYDNLEQGEKDCKRVIDVKWSHWKYDFKMKEYVNYETLFRSGNFYRYLQEEKWVWLEDEKGTFIPERGKKYKAIPESEVEYAE